MIANLDPFGPPLIADMDTGYGGTYIASIKNPVYFDSHDVFLKLRSHNGCSHG